VQMTRPGTLAGIFVLCALGAWLAVRVTFTSLPLLPVGPIPVLAALALGEAVVGRNVRGRLTGRISGKRLAPIAIARLVALAKASSAAAAVIGGLLAGYLAYVLGQLDKTIPARDARLAGITLACALALVAAALYLERCCQAPKPPDDDDDEDESYRDNWSWHE
jgi:Protein of unknown function (DUF3180)